MKSATTTTEVVSRHEQLVRWNWSSGNSCCASGRHLGSQHRCFVSTNRDDSLWENFLCKLQHIFNKFSKQHIGLQFRSGV